MRPLRLGHAGHLLELGALLLALQQVHLGCDGSLDVQSYVRKTCLFLGG